MVEAASLAFSVAQTLLTALQSPDIRGLFSKSNYESELEDLHGLKLSPQEWDFIDSLKDIIYEADDLIDEFHTVALQQQHQSHEEVQNFFSRFGKLAFGCNNDMSRKVKRLRKKMDQVADDAQKFCFKIDDVPIRKRREETCSYVNVNDIVGRDDDKGTIVDMLLDPKSSQQDVSVVTIVGIGGLGKTALAQLVFNDPMIENNFPLRMWVCVSDQDQNQFDVKQIIANILKSSSTCLGQLVQQLRKKLDRNKYLLVLDDVWTENSGDWLKLKPYLEGLSRRGNKIVVTTRSKGTAIVIKSSHIYKLQGLSDSYSWRLFEMMVGSEEANSPDLVEIGKDIVKKCTNVPLAIKVIGSLLYGQERSTWISFQNSRLMEIRKGENDIMPILEFSYRHLSSQLKSCFTYCALFPKDFVFDKEKLLDLWLAQDYVEPFEEGQNIEDAAEEYFLIMSRRCFFLDVESNELGEVVAFKMHDLMHDMAQQVAGKEISIANSTTKTLDKRIRHLYDDAPYTRTQGFMVGTKIRTYVLKYYASSPFPVSTLLANWSSLRTLDLREVDVEKLPDTIGELLHLRYLDISDNYRLKMLPWSLTKLTNLQFLNFRGCNHVKKIPNDLNKLVNLRTLYVCGELESLALGIEKMTHLTRLNMFIVGDQRKSCLKLEGLRALRNLKGSLQIYVRGGYGHTNEDFGKGGYISNTEHLSFIYIRWGNEEWRLCNNEDVLEDLKPHTNLKELRIERYGRVRMAGWARGDSLMMSLPNLVKVVLCMCDELKELPLLGRLQHLKTLRLSELMNVEYMENTGKATNSSAIVESSILLFPSLEKLELFVMPNLKGWWREMPTHTLSSFPRLSNLCIEGCPNMTYIPICPAMENMVLDGLNERFRGELVERYKHAISM